MLPVGIVKFLWGHRLDLGCTVGLLELLEISIDLSIAALDELISDSVGLMLHTAGLQLVVLEGGKSLSTLSNVDLSH